MCPLCPIDLTGNCVYRVDGSTRVTEKGEHQPGFPRKQSLIKRTISMKWNKDAKTDTCLSL